MNGENITIYIKKYRSNKGLFCQRNKTKLIAK